MSIYFIRQGTDGHVKIGFATNAAKRLDQLQTGHSEVLSIIRLLEGTKEDEVRLHQRFGELRLTGEWFKFSDAMLTEDFGLTELEIPPVRRARRSNFDTTGWDPEEILHYQLITAVGGREALARRLRVAPWELTRWEPHRHRIRLRKRYWSALIVMLHEIGRHDITYDVLAEYRTPYAARSKQFWPEHKQGMKRRDREFEAQKRAEAEQDWLARNGPEAAWWPISTTPQSE
ncbi:GIY-YIG nuclease family protein [Microvirga aerophila]|uniref:GIY-YIG nuclease family protein n=1 Tax=Microvirga aerophila TaxID=670291 RepID=A0A512C1J1_9HYPH|nr:GIY-YIG nuclease family protein [Microvirga aerophila]GEO18084.1 hypothetical protein MAE02_57800 [Microvirga aerophila]